MRERSTASEIQPSRGARKGWGALRADAGRASTRSRDGAVRVEPEAMPIGHCATPSEAFGKTLRVLRNFQTDIRRPSAVLWALRGATRQEGASAASARRSSPCGGSAGRRPGEPQGVQARRARAPCRCSHRRRDAERRTQAKAGSWRRGRWSLCSLPPRGTEHYATRRPPPRPRSHMPGARRGSR